MRLMIYILFLYDPSFLSYTCPSLSNDQTSEVFFSSDPLVDPISLFCRINFCSCSSMCKWFYPWPIIALFSCYHVDILVPFFLPLHDQLWTTFYCMIQLSTKCACGTMIQTILCEMPRIVIIIAYNQSSSFSKSLTSLTYESSYYSLIVYHKISILW